MSRAVFAAIGRARAASIRVWYSLNAPRSIDDVDRADVRPMFLWLRARYGTSGRGDRNESQEPWRPQYAWGILRAAMIARALGIESISAIEFGVAGGNGLVAMETLAAETELLLGVGLSVFGFDTGSGMPRPMDHRDAPFSVREGQFPMDVEKLRARLRRAELMLGPVGDTLTEFLRARHAPIGFISFDVDYYSSTTEALAALDADSDRLLPRVLCCVQGLMWHPWTEFNGARAAINDFNRSHERRKLSPLYGLKYSLPGSEWRRPWPEMMYVAEIFDHELYATDQRIPPKDQRLAD